MIVEREIFKIRSRVNWGEELSNDGKFMENREY